MRRAELKLNPEKCVFGVMKGKILGCLISTKRIKANLDKIRAIREMEEPKTKKDIQKLNGRVQLSTDSSLDPLSEASHS
jgi:hypothetical protein